MARKQSSGALRTPVAIGKPVIVKDATGAESITWSEFVTWADIAPANGREWATNIAKDAIDTRIRVRSIPNWLPDARWRIRETESGRIYNIVSALIAGQFGFVECLAKSAQGNTDGR